MNKDYTIGIYIRLSMADEDTGTGNKAESDSIEIVWKFKDIFEDAEI